MRTTNDKNKFIDILSETPFISYACRKSGIAKATVYRWLRDNPEFKQRVDKAIREGREHLSEIGELALVKKVKEGDLKAITFFLGHNNRRYLPKDRVYLSMPRDLMEFDALDQRKPLPDKGRGGLSDNPDINWLRMMESDHTKDTDKIKAFKEIMKMRTDELALKIKLSKMTGGEEQK